MTSLPAQCGGKVWSWKEVVSVFFPTRLKVNAGENKFWLAGLVSLKIFKIGFFHPHSDVFQVRCLSAAGRGGGRRLDHIFCVKDVDI